MKIIVRIVISLHDGATIIADEFFIRDGKLKYSNEYQSSGSIPIEDVHSIKPAI